MDEVIAAIITTATMLGAAAVAAAPKIKAAREALAPMLRRRSFPVVILAPSSALHEIGNARDFAIKLRRGAFREVRVTSKPIDVAGAAVIIVWHPPVHGCVEICEQAMQCAPEARQLVLTYQRLPQDLTLGEHRILENSEVRLLSDLAVVAGA